MTDDVLAPELLKLRGSFGTEIQCLGTVQSTQNELKAWQDAPHGAVVVAENQLAGRGRMGKTWNTTQGMLTFSVLLKDNLDGVPVAPLAAGVALALACNAKEWGGGLKWPNDLLSPSLHKMAGILLEAELRGGVVQRGILGIGINIKSAPAGASYLDRYYHISRANLLAEILFQLEHWLNKPKQEIIKAWRECSITLGKEVDVNVRGNSFRGTASGIDENGGLILVQGNKTTVISTGDVHLITEL